MTQTPGRYEATLKHPSILRARVLDVGNSLHGAKIKASRLTKDQGEPYHLVVIRDRDNGGRIVAERRLDAKAWVPVYR